MGKTPQDRVMTAIVGSYPSYLPPEQLILVPGPGWGLAPDCGMLQLSRAAAGHKLVNLARAARELNGQG